MLVANGRLLLAIRHEIRSYLLTLIVKKEEGREKVVQTSCSKPRYLHQQTPSSCARAASLTWYSTRCGCA